MAKYVKRGVKRKHNIIQDILPLLEYIAKIEGVKKVVPAKISYSPTRGIIEPTIKFQRDTISGFKLVAHGRGAMSKKNDIRYKLRCIQI